MGHTLKTLAEKQIEKKSIFNNRFVVEICERVHTHYRNLRITQTLDDFIMMAECFQNAIERWKKRGCPGTGQGVHIELCRRNLVIVDDSDMIKVNLNDNLYIHNKDKIYSMGNDFEEEKYIHLKYRDLRFEMSINEFKEFANVIAEADKRLADSDTCALLQKA